MVLTDLWKAHFGKSKSVEEIVLHCILCDSVIFCPLLYVVVYLVVGCLLDGGSTGAGLWKRMYSLGQ